MAETTSPRSSTHPRRRRAAIRYERRVNSFARVVEAFNRGLAEHFPLIPYRDCLGRSRVSGRARRARAQAVLQALLRRQAQVRSGVVYLGYQALGSACHRSRSTAYRAVVDLVQAELLSRTPGGGKTHDERGQLVEAANGYAVPDPLQGRAGPRGGRRGKSAATAPAAADSPGQRLAQERLERWRSGEVRAGP